MEDNANETQLKATSSTLKRLTSAKKYNKLSIQEQLLV